MTETAQLYGPVAGDISAVGERLRALSDGHHPLLGEALAYVFQTSGKQMRPALVMLCGKLGVYDRDRLVTLAASLEVVHTATLVHDDTIDEAISRRGLTTVSELWDRKVAILIGDFLFAQSAHLAAQLESVPVMTLLSETVMAMSSGELRQYASSRDRLVDEGDYFQRIAGKTASLFAMCCAGAAIVSGQTAHAIEALRRYGMNLGLAFQIVDDVLDLIGDEKTLGKPAGGDLRQGTITLPYILFLQDQPPDSHLRRGLEPGGDLERLITAVRASNAPRQALTRAQAYAAEARRALDAFPPSEARDALVQLTDRVVERDR
jgi:geranylgeranyl pyrophosphate synthase